MALLYNKNALFMNIIQNKKGKCIIISLVIFWVILINLKIFAQPGTLDNTFSGDGIVTTALSNYADAAQSIALQKDGKIVVAGYCGNGTNTDLAVNRYLADGNLDSSFDDDGKLIIPIGTGQDAATSVNIQEDGKIVLTGTCQFGSYFDFVVVRLNTNGGLDSTFDQDGIQTTSVGIYDDVSTSSTIQPDGKIIVAGYYSNGTNSDFAIVRYNYNGSLDTTFDMDGMQTTNIFNNFEYCNSVALQSDGKIVAVGYGKNDLNNDFVVIRYNSNGSLDSSFDNDGIVTTAIGNSDDQSRTVVIQTDGKIVTAGNSYNDFALIRYNTNGTLDTTFSNDGIALTDLGSNYDKLFSLSIQSDGKFVVTGTTGSIDRDFAIVRYYSNGNLDNTFNGDGILFTPVGSSEDVGYCIAIQPDEKIIVAGSSFNSTTKEDFAIVRYNNFSQTGWQVYNTSNSLIPGNIVSSVSIDEFGNKWLCMDGGGLVKFDGINWKNFNTFNSGIPHSQTYKSVFTPDGILWVGSWGGLGRLNDTLWEKYTTSNSLLPNNTIFSLVTDNFGNLWIGTFGGGLAKYDGKNNWNIFNTGNSNIPGNDIRALLWENNRLWVGTKDSGVAVFDGLTWTKYNNLNSGLPDNSVMSIAREQNGTIWFGTLNGGVAKLVGNTWTVYNSSNSSLPNDNIRSVYIDSGNMKWFGGNGGLAKYDDSDWTVFTTANSGLPVNQVYNIISDNNKNMWLCTYSAGLTVFNPNGINLTIPNAVSEWYPLNASTANNINSIFFIDSKRGWGCTSNGQVMMTINGGQTWEIKKISGNWLSAIQFFDSLNGYCVGWNSSIYRTNNGGVSWDTLTHNLPSFQISSLFMTSTNKIFIGSPATNYLYYSDNGSNWINANGITSNISSITFTDSLKGFCSSFGSKIFKSSNGGINWQEMNVGANVNLNGISFADSLNGWVCGDSGRIYMTTDGGLNWSFQNTNTQLPLIKIKFINKNTGYAVGGSSNINALILKTVDGGNFWKKEVTDKKAILYSVSFPDSLNGFVCGNAGTVLKYSKGTINESSDITDSTTNVQFDTSGVTINFSDIAINNTSIRSYISVTKISEKLPQNSYEDTISTIFNNYYWMINTTNIDTFKANVCFNYNPAQLNTSYLNNLNCAWQVNNYSKWKIINTIPAVDSEKICFETDHFSNWAIAISKPIAKYKMDTNISNLSPDTMRIFDSFEQNEVMFQTHLLPSQTGIFNVNKYNINPGGNLPSGVLSFLETYWEISTNKTDSLGIYFEMDSVIGFKESDKDKYIILYRPNSITDWEVLSSLRVKKGMKESLKTKNINSNGHYIFGKITNPTELFYDSVSVQTACAGDSVFFTSFVINGEPPYKYIWSGDDNFSSTQENATHVYNSMGTYTFKLSVEDANGTITDYNGNVVIGCVNLAFVIENSFEIYPNPVDMNYLILKWDIPVSEDITVNLFNITGKKIFEKKFYISGDSYTLKLNDSEIQKGVYLLFIKNKNGYSQKIFVKQ